MNTIPEDKGLAAAAQAVLAASFNLHEATRMLEASVAALLVYAVSKDDPRFLRSRLPLPSSHIPKSATPAKRQTPKPARAHKVELTEEDRAKIRKLVKSGMRQIDVAAQYEISQTTVSLIVNGRTKPITHGLAATVAGMITQALRRLGEPTDRESIIENINNHHETSIPADSVRRTTNEMVAKGTLVLDGKLYSLPE